jgi:hypothetical protein
MIFSLYFLHIALLPIEFYLQSFPRSYKSVLDTPGDFTNKIISILCMSYFSYLCVYGIIYDLPSTIVANFIVKYFIYDLLFMLGNIKEYYLFIIHHLFTITLIYIGYDMYSFFGNDIFLTFEITTPILHSTKLSKIIAPNYTKFLKKANKNIYFFFRILYPPIWITYKLFNYNKSLTQLLILSGIGCLWKVSLMWWKKMM